MAGKVAFVVQQTQKFQAIYAESMACLRRGGTRFASEIHLGHHQNTNRTLRLPAILTDEVASLRLLRLSTCVTEDLCRFVSQED